MRIVYLILLGLGTFSLVSQAQLADPDVSAIRKDVMQLTTDEFRGRGTGDIGYNLAANYVAEQLLALGFHSFKTDQRPAEKTADFFIRCR